MTGLNAEGANFTAARETHEHPLPGIGDALDGDEGAVELQRLEALLRERAREVSQRRSELARLQVLLRDRLSHLDAVRAAHAGGVDRDLVALRAACDAAVCRALEAEVARAEAVFRADEALGHLRLASNGEPRNAELGGERAELDVARLAGTARGLRCALAEAEDARDIAQARLLLAEQDLADGARRVRTLEREAAEAREQLEFILIETRSLDARLAGSLEAAQASALLGENNGLRARVAEAERALLAAARELATARATAVRAEQALAAALAQPSQAGTGQHELSLKISELERMLARENELKSMLSTELIGARAQGIVLGDELARAKREAAARVDALTGALHEARETLLGLSTSLPRTSTRSAPTKALDPAESWLGEATEPGVPAYIEVTDEQLALRDARIALLSRDLERERSRSAAVVQGLRELSAGSEPVRPQVLADLLAAVDRKHG